MLNMLHLDVLVDTPLCSDSSIHYTYRTTFHFKSIILFLSKSFGLVKFLNESLINCVEAVFLVKSSKATITK